MSYKATMATMVVLRRKRFMEDIIHERFSNDALDQQIHRTVPSANSDTNSEIYELSYLAGTWLINSREMEGYEPGASMVPNLYPPSKPLWLFFALTYATTFNQNPESLLRESIP
uniref:Uncharacterized protein n=1 Tax=Vespula pensylvanica TaxID=30213 RepID=A0A834UFJ7_VESPE|nr:hypothetical protein H0235_000157 [Vespula pensylvanica]